MLVEGVDGDRQRPTAFDARDVSYLPIVLVTDPPKRRLSFALDHTRYEVVLTLDTMRGAVVPAT